MIEEKEILEGNRLIAEFLEWEISGPGFASGYANPHNTYCHFEDLKFHSSWDWLMPVIKKIREIINVELNIDSFEEIRERKLTLNPYDYDMEQVYKAVVEFIKWYNQNKND